MSLFINGVEINVEKFKKDTDDFNRQKEVKEWKEKEREDEITVKKYSKYYYIDEWWKSGIISECMISWNYFTYIKSIHNPNSFPIRYQVAENDFMIESGETEEFNLFTGHLVYADKMFTFIPQTIELPQNVMEEHVREVLQETMRYKTGSWWSKQLVEFIESEDFALCDDLDSIEKEDISATFPPIFLCTGELPDDIINNINNYSNCKEVIERIQGLKPTPIECPDNMKGCLVAHYRHDPFVNEEHQAFRKILNDRPRVSFEELCQRWQKYHNQRLNKRIDDCIEEHRSKHTDGKFPNLDLTVCTVKGDLRHIPYKGEKEIWSHKGIEYIIGGGSIYTRYTT